MLDGFDDHDGVVDDDADCEHEPEESQVIERKTQREHHQERADDSHGHGNQRDDCRPPVLKENQHDQRDQDHRIEQRFEDLVD